jgi:acetyl esterase/lipase
MPTGSRHAWCFFHGGGWVIGDLDLARELKLIA